MISGNTEIIELEAIQEFYSTQLNLQGWQGSCLWFAPGVIPKHLPYL